MSYSTSFAAGASFASDNAIYDLLVGQSSLVKARLDTLTEQASTGLVSSVFSGLGGASATALDLRAELAYQQAESTGIAAASQSTTLTQSALTQISAIGSQFYAQTASLSSLEPSNVDVQAANARAALKQLVGLLNTQNGDSYIFGGSASGAPPVPSGDDILSSPFVASITASVQGLAVNGATATIAATLGTASSNAPGVSPFSAQLSQPAVALASGLPSVELSPGTRVTIGIAASANTAAISYGTSTTGSYIRDLLRGLATVGALSSSQVNDPGFDALVADTHASFGGAIDAISDEQGILGNTQSRIEAAGTVLTASGIALKAQVSNIQDVDLAAVSVELTQTQANLQASYKLIASVGQNSLLKYL